MKLNRDANVFTVDGENIGKVKRLVLDPRSKKVISLVFEHGLLTRTEYLVPIELVDHIDESGVHLSKLPVDNFIELQRFRDTDFVITDEHALLDGNFLTDRPASTYYHYPTAAFGNFGDSNVLPPDEPARTQGPADFPGGTVPLRMTSPGAEPPVRQVEDDNIAPDNVALKKGARVISSDMKTLGSVEKIFIDPKSERATHLLVTKGLLNKEKKLVPVDWVERMEEEEIHLAMKEAVIDRLPEYQE